MEFPIYAVTGINNMNEVEEELTYFSDQETKATITGTNIRITLLQYQLTVEYRSHSPE